MFDMVEWQCSACDGCGHIEAIKCQACDGAGWWFFPQITQTPNCEEPMSNIKLLIGHVSPETAYVVDDYPYGFTMRCKIRYWLEYKPGTGFRLMSQTTNPKRGDVWNKPKASTYSRFGGAMFLDDEGHVQWNGLGEYSDAKEAIAFRDQYGAGVPEAGRAILDKWVAAKVAYEANRNDGDHLAKGLPEARKAWNEAGN